MIRRFVLGLSTGCSTPLQTVASVFNSVLIRALARGQALDTYPEALVIHHGEHRGQTPVGLTNQIPDRFIEIHHAGG